MTLSKIISALLVVFFLGFSVSAHAKTIDELTAALNTKSYNKKAEIVGQIASSGHERAGAILEALSNKKLFIVKADKSVVFGEKNGKSYIISNPVSGELIGEVEKKALGKVKINNKVRGAIKLAMGQLNLFSEDASVRLAAAKSVFKSTNKDMLPVLSALLEKEENESVHDAFSAALSAIELVHSDDMNVQLAAVESLTEQGGPEVKALLSKTLIALKKEVDIDPQLTNAIEDGLETIDRRLATLGMIENVFQGLSLASVLLLAAIGLAITFGVMGVINMAHGEMVMLGAYTTYVIQETCRIYAPGLLDFSLIAAIPAAFVVSGLFGIALERSVIRFLYGRPLETLLATWGISLILQQFVRTIFGPTNKEVSTPSWLSGSWEITSGLTMTYNRIAIIIFALIVLFFLMLVLKKTLFGLQMRAVTQNRSMARSMGVRSSAVDALTFGLGSGVAGMAGVALSQIDNVSPNLGQAYIIDSFMVVVFGGVGNLWGTLVGAGSLGVVNKFLEPYSGAVLAKILVLVAIILFIQKRPRGLFALKGRSVEG